MKRISTLLAVCFFGILSTFAQGWPAQYGGVMLQGFYWDSYSDSQWTTLESQADELSQYFSLIWVPQSGWCNDFFHELFGSYRKNAYLCTAKSIIL